MRAGGRETPEHSARNTPVPRSLPRTVPALAPSQGGSGKLNNRPARNPPGSTHIPVFTFPCTACRVPPLGRLWTAVFSRLVVSRWPLLASPGRGGGWGGGFGCVGLVGGHLPVHPDGFFNTTAHRQHCPTQKRTVPSPDKRLLDTGSPTECFSESSSKIRGKSRKRVGIVHSRGKDFKSDGAGTRLPELLDQQGHLESEPNNG